MAERLDLEELPGIAIHLRRHARARRMSLRVGRSDGQVSLTLPPRVSLAEAEAFARDRAGWIAGNVAAAPAPVEVAVGATIPLRGRPVAVIAGDGRSARLRDGTIAVPRDAHSGRRVRALLTELGRSHLVEAVDRYAAAIDRRPTKLTVRDTRSRWGSCTSRGGLMLSWRLVMAPPEVLDYVAAHEVAHLVHMDHSARFWAQVGALMPGYARPRDWLRREGASLHAIRFGEAGTEGPPGRASSDEPVR